MIWDHKSVFGFSQRNAPLDYWLVSNGIINQIKECKIVPVSFSDYAAVSFALLSKDYEKRGPGFFKFNNSLLKDSKFLTILKRT